MMNRIRKRAVRSLRALYASAARFFPSCVCAVALALTLAFQIDLYDVEFLCAGLAAALFASVPTTLATELRGLSRRRALGVQWAVSLVFGALFGALRFALAQSFLSPWSRYFEMLLAGFLTLCAVLSYVLLMRRDNEQTLFLRVLAAFAYGVALPLLLTALLSVCLLAFNALIHSLPELVLELILCQTMIALPVVVFLALLPCRGEDERRFLRFESVDRVIVGALSAVYMGLLAILLLYVGKIVITRQMPVGEMNWYASFALLYYLLLWLTPASTSKNPACRLYARFGGWPLLPVIAVQIYGIGVRFIAYGLTTARYLSMVCLALGVFALALTLMRRSLRSAFLAAIAAIAIVSFTPLNAIEVPVMEQEARMRAALSENGMLDGDAIVMDEPPQGETYARLISCFDYLRRAPAVRRSAFWQANFSRENLPALKEKLGVNASASGRNPGNYSLYFHNDTLKSATPVDGYAYVKAFDTAHLYAQDDFALRIALPDQQELVYNPGPLFEKFARAQGTPQSGVEMRFELDDRTTLILDYLSVRYADYTLNSIAFSGLALIRE